ncbi:MAG: SAM-dependent methyltransferase, partial [Oscillospiraceae bacterium]|nr:SAM-dependent methyltransferase [Oscillospiraceae bacterium]
MTKPDYKNWMPKGMVLGTLAGAVGCLGLAAVCGCTPLLNGKAKCGLTAAFLLSGAAAGAAALWMGRMYRAFSYDGDRQMS